MAPDAAAIQRAFQEVCGEEAFDADTLAFITSTVEEEPPDDAQALWDAVGAFLEDAGVAADETAGLKLCGRLFAQLFPATKETFSPPARGKAQAKASSSKPAGGGSALEKPIMLSSLLNTGDGVKANFADAWSVGPSDVPSGGLDEMPQEQLKVVAAIGKAKKEKAARRAERRAWRADVKTEDDAVWVDLPTGQSIGSGGAVDLHLDRVTLPNKRGSGDLLTNVTCTFAQGRRYGILGRNGVGKSTLLDAIARRELPGIPDCSIFYVRQEVEGDSRLPMEWLLQADSERQLLVAEKERLETEGGKDVATRLPMIYQRLEEMDGGSSQHSQETKAIEILKGLGFDETLKSKATRDLSGGWRMRVALACALYVSPGLLLLDEPTNHLDLETVIWLERYLNTEFHQTLLVVSHDRMFLNEVVSDIVLVENEDLQVYKGDYHVYEKIREEHKLRQDRLHEQQEAKREHLQEFITKHAEAGSNGCKAAAQRKSRMRKLERLGMEASAGMSGRKMKLSYDGVQDDVQETQAAQSVVLSFPDPGVCDSLGNPLLRFDDASFGYGDAPALFSGVSFSVDQSSRIAVLGKNGCGKTTLIKLLLGKEKPRTGTCYRNRGAKIQYIAQHHLDELDGESTPLKMALDRFPGDGSNTHELKMRMHLASFGLGGEVLPHQIIRTLSGGQKFRVSLALALYTKPHLLVMDEPTNHLDMETIDALVKAIQDFQGGVCIVSHDEHLISSICKELRLMANKKCTRFPGGIADYKKLVVK